ncbi:MAG: single-stranded DNA-binding protein [Planctomycetes bacterium]|nr:single-stranded DNA-binding protein [Planctomycetota bacterium]
MPSYNRVLLMGNLTADPELRYTQSGTPVCSFRIAVNEVYKTPSGEKKETVTFIPITIWRKQAETCAEYLKKGRPVLVEGKLKMSQWTSKEGEKRSKLEVVGLGVKFLSSGPAGDRSAERAASHQGEQPEPPSEPMLDEEESEDIPF